MRQPVGLALSPDGANLYVAGSFEGALVVFRRDPASGRPTSLEERRDGCGGIDGLNGAWSNHQMNTVETS